MSHIIHHTPRRALRAGTPMSRSTQATWATIGRWLGALALTLLIGVAGRMEMDDAIIAEQMRVDLAAAVAANPPETPRCHRSELRKTPANDNSRARCKRVEEVSL